MFKEPVACSEQLEDISILLEDPGFTKGCSLSAPVLFRSLSRIVSCHVPIVSVEPGRV